MATSKEQLQIIVDAQGIAKTKAQLKSMDKASGGVTKSFGAMAVGIAGATVALYAMGKAVSAAIKVSKDFEQGMANVKAISGATGVEFKALEANARKLGASTKFTATEVAGLQTEFSKLGFTATEINKVTEGTLALAAATGSDLATSAAVGGATLRGFGLDATETGRVTDVMAKSFSSSALDMQKFSDSMKYVAPIAKIAGVNIEGTTAILGQLANAGIDGSMAGTSLRKILLEAGKEGSKLAKRMGGPIKSFEDFQEKLRKLKKDGFDPLVDGADAVGQRAVTAFSILLDGADSVDTLNEALKNAGGSAQEMADIQLDTLEGKMTIMNSAMEGLGIAIGDKLSQAIQSAVEGFTGLLGVMTDLITKGDQAFIKFDDMSDALSQAQINATQVRAEFNSLTNQLLSLARQTELSANEEERRNGIIDELQTKYPNYLSNLDQEADDYLALSRHIASAKRSLEDYLEAQIKQATAKVFVKDIAETNAALEKVRANLDIAELQLENEKGLRANLGVYKIFTKTLKDGSVHTMGNADAVEYYTKQTNKLGMDLGILEEGYRNASIEAERLAAAPPPGSDINLIQFPEGQDVPLPPSILGTPTEDQITVHNDIMAQFREQSFMDQLNDFQKSKEWQILSAEERMEIISFYGNKEIDLQKKIDKAKIKQRQDADKQLIAGAVSALSQFRGTAVAAARIQQISATIDAYKTITKIMADPKLLFPTNVITATAVGLQAFANVTAISKSIGEFGGTRAQFGMDEVVDKPTMILAGEAGREQVSITPLEGPNLDGPQGGSSITLNISAPLVDETVIDHIIPAINEAVRRGETLATS